jgi:hypothetical protein
MGENQIKVTATTNKPLRVNVTAPGSQGNVTLSPDSSAYNAGLAEQWAISDKLVLGKDYSSKYYANQAKENALSVESFAEDVSSIYNSFTEISEQAINELNTTRDEAIVTINERFEEGLGEGANQITELVNSSIAEYTEISNQIKQDNSEASKLAQDWAISEVLVDNIDYSAKYYAEKAKDNSGIFYDELVDEDIDVEILDTNYATKSDLELGLDTKQDKGDYALRSEIPSITHLATKNEVNAKQDKGDYATRTELVEGLDTKQAKGNYALKSEIPNISNLATKDELPTQVSELENDSNYATQTQVLQAIASIPQFSLSIVEALPTTGAKMTLYLVPKEGTNNDVYDEYIWIEQSSSFEHLGTTAVDLTDYVKNTDIATSEKAGIAKINLAYGININNQFLTILKASDNEVKGKGNLYRPIVPANLDLAVKTGVTTNTIELTDDEKTSARTWLGAVGGADYATSSKAGVVRISGYGLNINSSNGIIYGSVLDNELYPTVYPQYLISRGTLDNVLTQYSKTVLTTEADYEALETKDANTLYLIEE